MDLPIPSQETELEILKRLVPMITNRTMLDVGASTGVFASYFALLGWEVHAFEPCPEVFAKLSANLSNTPNVRCHPLALTDRNGRETLHIAERTDGTVMDFHHTIVPYEPTSEFRWGGSTEVTCARLDSACSTLGITGRPGILKINTAGSEFQVLKGLGEVLPDVIMVEFWEDSHPFGKCPSPPHLMLEFLHERGYRDYFFITRNDEEELLQINTSHIRAGDWGNIITVHQRSAELFYAAIPDLVYRSQQRLLSLLEMSRTAVLSEGLKASAGQELTSQVGRNSPVSRLRATVVPTGPLVSIITPSYNQGRFIEETILSVLTQDYPNIEYIVMDGGSTDNTLDILKKYEGRLTWISEPDRGQSHAINKGFQMAKGEILAWLNSDDTYLPGAISKVVQHFQTNPESMMVYGEGYLIDEHSRVKQRFPYTEKFDLWKLIYLWDNILQQTAFFRCQVFDQIDPLDENLHYGMDWDLWIRIGKKFRVDYIPEYLGNLREYSEAKTFSGGTTRFNELVSLMRRHGTMRFPPAYFTYGFGTYNRTMFGRLAHQYPHAYRFLFSILRLLGQRVCSLITRYLVNHSQGYYSDGWASRRAHFLLVNPGQAACLKLEGELPNLRRGYRTAIRARLNGRPLGDPITVLPGHFKLEWPIPEEMRSSNLFEVTLLSTRWYLPYRVGVSAKRRRLSYRVTRIAAE